jgi:hypothetical protein
MPGEKIQVKYATSPGAKIYRDDSAKLQINSATPRANLCDRLTIVRVMRESPPRGLVPGGPSTPVQAASSPRPVPKGTLGSIPHLSMRLLDLAGCLGRIRIQPILEVSLELLLPASLKTLVSAYVRSKNRQALENMRELRRQLLERLQSTSSNNAARSRNSLLEDLRVIEEGLEQLRLPGRG